MNKGKCCPASPPLPRPYTSPGLAVDNLHPLNPNSLEIASLSTALLYLRWYRSSFCCVLCSPSPVQNCDWCGTSTQIARTPPHTKKQVMHGRWGLCMSSAPPSAQPSALPHLHTHCRRRFERDSGFVMHNATQKSFAVWPNWEEARHSCVHLRRTTSASHRLRALSQRPRRRAESLRKQHVRLAKIGQRGMPQSQEVGSWQEGRDGPDGKCAAQDGQTTREGCKQVDGN